MLSNPEKREKYDQNGDENDDEDLDEDIDFMEILQMGLGEIFEMFNNPHKKPRKKSDDSWDTEEETEV